MKKFFSKLIKQPFSIFLISFFIIMNVNFEIFIKTQAMYKTRNTGTGNGMRGTRGMGRNVIFRGMSSNISGNVSKHSAECPQTFRAMSPVIPWNVAKYSGMSSNILWNVLKYSRECRQTFRRISSDMPGNAQTFWGMSSNIPGNVAYHSRASPQTFRGMSSNIPGNAAKHSGECHQTFRGMS